jgi:hypothetical protein
MTALDEAVPEFLYRVSCIRQQVLSVGQMPTKLKLGKVALPKNGIEKG